MTHDEMYRRMHVGKPTSSYGEPAFVRRQTLEDALKEKMLYQAPPTMVNVRVFIDADALTAKKIHFSGPVTCVVWANGEKTVVRASDNDTFDAEKGVAMCFMRHVLELLDGNGQRYHDILVKAAEENDSRVVGTLPELITRLLGSHQEEKEEPDKA